MHSRITTLLLTALLLALPLSSTAQWTNDPWNGMVTVCNESGDQEYMQMFSFDNGNTLIAWLDFRSDTTGLYQVYYQILSPAGECLLEPNGRLVFNGDWGFNWGGGSEKRNIMPDDNGGCIIVCKDNRDGDYNIYGQCIDAWGNRLWGDEGLPLVIWPGDDATIQDFFCDQIGNFFVSWGCHHPSIVCDLYTQKFDVDGNRLWGDYGVPLCIGANFFHPEWSHGVSDGNGGAVITWRDDRNSVNLHWYLYMQHLDEDGNPLLMENGVEVHLNIISPAIIGDIFDGIPDGEGGGIWAWDGQGWGGELNLARISGEGRTIWEWSDDEDYHNEILSFIQHPVDGNYWLSALDDRTGEYVSYLYCFDIDGNALFGHAGFPTGGYSLIPRPDGVLNCDWTYTDRLSRVFSRLVDFNGQLVWESDVALAQSPVVGGSAFWTCAGASDGNDGLVVAFCDARNFETNGYDVAAQRVMWNGNLAWTIYAPPFQQRSLNAELTQIGNTLRYTLPQASEVTLELYDILGRRVRVLEQGYLPSGSHSFHLSNQNLPSGIYLLHLSTPSTRLTEKIVIMR